MKERNILLGMTALALAALLCACGTAKTASTTPAETATTAAETELTDPGVPAEPYDVYALTLPGDFAESDEETLEVTLGAKLAAPKLAERSLIGLSADESTAVITFDFEHTVYTLWVGKTLPEAPAVMEETEEADWVGFPYTLGWSADGSGLAEWKSERYGLNYRLYAERDTDHDRLKEVAVILLPAE